MWISEPTPVISSTKHIDSWSSCRPKSTCSSPTGTQLKSFSPTARSSPARPAMSANSSTPRTKEPSDVAQPSRWPQGSAHLPDSSSIAAPARGRAIRSQTGIVIAALVFQQAGVVDRGRTAGAEDGHDDGKPDDDLARRDHHGEERHHLAVEMPVH